MAVPLTDYVRGNIIGTVPSFLKALHHHGYAVGHLIGKHAEGLLPDYLLRYGTEGYHGHRILIIIERSLRHQLKKHIPEPVHIVSLKGRYGYHFPGLHPCLIKGCRIRKLFFIFEAVGLVDRKDQRLSAAVFLIDEPCDPLLLFAEFIPGLHDPDYDIGL